MTLLTIFGAAGRAAVVAAGRFPLALATMAAITILSPLHWPEPSAMHAVFGDWLVPLAATFWWSVAIRTALETRTGAPASMRHLLPWVAAAFLLFGPQPLDTMTEGHWLVLWTAAGVLAVTAVPLAGPRPVPADRSAVWLLGVGFALMLGATVTVLLCGGISLLSVSIDGLFDTDITPEIIDHLWSYGLSLLLPWCFLALLPGFEPADRGRTAPTWIRGLIDFVLAPLALAYVLMLNGYAVFVLVQGALPKGLVATLVVGFAVIGGTVWAIAFAHAPERRWPSRLLLRVFLPGLLAPTVLLFIAAWQRIAQHGMTEGRYLLFVAGVVLILLAALQLARRRVPTPPAAALVAASALVLCAAVPWSATAVSLDSQVERLRHSLVQAGVLHADRVVATGGFVTENETWAIRSRTLYIVAHGGEAAILDWFDLASRPSPSGERPRDRVEAIMAAYGIRSQTRVAWDTPEPQFLRTTGFDTLLPHRYLNAFGGALKSETPEGDVTLKLAETGLLRVARSDRTLAEFDLAPLLEEDTPAATEPIALDATADDGTRLRLLVTHVEGQRLSETRIQLHSAGVRLLIGIAE